MRLIEKVWFQQHSAKWLLVPILLPLTCFFWLLSSLRRQCYRFKLLKSYKISKPVIVVGNIGIGGNGKTPVVVCLVEHAKKWGLSQG
jgi:tetraacyldisaccharide 4'-kinase